MFKRFLIDLVTRRPWFGIWLSLFLLAAGLAGAVQLTIMPDLRVFFSEGNPDKIRLDRFEKEFVRENTAILSLSVERGDVFGKQPMKALADITERAWKLPYVRRVDTVANFMHSRSDGDGGLIAAPILSDPGKATALDRAKARAAALSHPEMIGGLISKDATATGVRVLFYIPDGKARGDIPLLLKKLENLRDIVKAMYPEIDIRIGGTVALDATLTKAVIKDLTTLIPLAIAVSLVVVGLSLRMPSASLMVLMLSSISAIASVGTMGWMGIPLNIGNIMAPVVVMTLSVSYAAHLFSTVRRTMAEEGVANAGKHERVYWIKSALDRHFLPLNMALFTTILGFLALNFSVSPPFRQLGNAVGLGLMATQIMTLTLLPSLVILLPFKARRNVSFVQQLIAKFAPVLLRRPRATLYSFLALCFVACTGITQLRIEDNFIGYFDHSFEFRRDADFIDQKLTGMNVLEFPMYAPGGRDGVNDPAFLGTADRFAAWARSRPHVAMVQSPVDMLKRVNMNLHNDDQAYYRLPETKAETAQSIMLLEMSLGYGMDLSDRITPDKSAVRLSVSLSQVTTSEIRTFEEEAKAWMEANAPTVQAEPTGITHVFTLISYRDSQAMLLGTAISLSLISFCMMFTLRNWRLGLISLAPNVLPIVCAFGLWGYFRGDVSLAITVVTSLTFGVIEDDTMHFLAEYQHLRRHGRALKDAVAEAFIGCGAGMVATSLALIAGFGIASCSGFAINRDMSALTVLTLSCGMACEFFLTPLLLLLVPHMKETEVVPEPFHAEESPEDARDFTKKEGFPV